MLKQKAKDNHESEHVAARLPRDQMKQIDELIQAGAFLNRADFLREAVRRTLETTVIITERKLPLKQVKATVLAYLEDHPVVYASDIALAKGIDFHLVMEAMQQLKDEGTLEETEGQRI